MANKFYNKQVGQMPSCEGWAPRANTTYKFNAKNGVGAGDRSGKAKDKRGPSPMKNGADKTGNKGMTFQADFKRKG